MITMSKKAKYFFAAAVVVLVGVCALAPLTVEAQVEVGDLAPDFSLYDIDGQEHTLSDYLGNVVYLVFGRST